MTDPLLTADDLAQIRIEPCKALPPFGPVRLVAPPHVQAVRDWLGEPTWTKVIVIVSGLERGEGASLSDSGHTLPHEWPEPDEPARPGVEVFTPLDRVFVEPVAFRRLLGRYLATICDAVNAQGHAWGKRPDWSRVEQQRDVLAEEAR